MVNEVECPRLEFIYFDCNKLKIKGVIYVLCIIECAYVLNEAHYMV